MPTGDVSFFIPYFLPQVIYFTIKYFSLRIVVSDSGFRIPVSVFRIPAFIILVLPCKQTRPRKQIRPCYARMEFHLTF